MATARGKPQRWIELGFVGRGKSRHRQGTMLCYYGRVSVYPDGDIKAANFHLQLIRRHIARMGFSRSKLWRPVRSA